VHGTGAGGAVERRLLSSRAIANGPGTGRDLGVARLGRRPTVTAGARIRSPGIRARGAARGRPRAQRAWVPNGTNGRRPSATVRRPKGCERGVSPFPSRRGAWQGGGGGGCPSGHRARGDGPGRVSLPPLGPRGRSPRGPGGFERPGP